MFMYLILKMQAWFTDMDACCRLINNVNIMSFTYKTVFYFHIERIFVVIKKINEKYKNTSYIYYYYFIMCCDLVCLFKTKSIILEKL